MIQCVRIESYGNARDQKAWNPEPTFCLRAGVRGETLARRGLIGQVLGRVKDAGVKVVIDFRTADHNDKFGRRCADVGIVYHHVPTDAQVMPPEELFAALPRLFEVLDGDGFYISCQQGLHRTDIALALYYFFHDDREVPEMFGHCKKGVLRCDDIMRRINVMRPFFPEVDEALFLQRRKRFLAFNREKAEERKNEERLVLEHEPQPHWRKSLGQDDTGML